jgi:hypothetical protein
MRTKIKRINTMNKKYIEILKEQISGKVIKECVEVGKHNDVPDSKFDENELKTGIEIEHEHTDDSEIAKKIAKDHLSEIPDYYTRLKKMEDDAKK